MTTSFNKVLSEVLSTHTEINQCSSLTYLQSIRIWQAEIDGLSFVGEILSPGLADEVTSHPAYIKGDEVWKSGKQDIAKMHYEDAEIAITSEYAYRIYLAVKAVLDKGSDLT